MWAYLAVIVIGVSYMLWKGATFFPALKQAQFQFAKWLQEGDVSQFAPFVNQVVASWPERMAVFPPGWNTACAIALGYAFGTLAFFLVRRAPRGKPLENGRNPGGLLPQRVQLAYTLAGVQPPLMVRTDGAGEAVGKDGAIYLPRWFAQKLDRKWLPNAAQQLAYVIVHETAHAAGYDNLLWSFGRTLVLIMTVLTATLLATPVMLFTVIAAPGALSSLLSGSFFLVLVAVTGAVVLGFIGAVMNAMFANLAAVREFFADAVATSVVGRSGLPYEGMDDEQRRGTLATGWSASASPPDRRLHAIGTTPRARSLAASAIAAWIAVRGAILMLDPSSGQGPILLFDAACTAAVIAMLSALPARAKGVRDYGWLPWLATFGLIILLPITFASIAAFAQINGVVGLISDGWLAVLAWPPVVVAAAVFAWQARRRDFDDIAPIDRLPPRARVLRAAVYLIAAVPSFAVSFATAVLLLFSLSLLVSDLLGASISGRLDLTKISWLDAIPLPAFAVVLLLTKNMSSPSRATILLETFIAATSVAITIYVSAVMYVVAAATSPTISAPVVDMAEFTRVFMSFPPALVLSSLTMAVVAGAILSISWWARYRMIYLRTNELGASPG